MVKIYILQKNVIILPRPSNNHDRGEVGEGPPHGGDDVQDDRGAPRRIGQGRRWDEGRCGIGGAGCDVPLRRGTVRLRRLRIGPMVQACGGGRRRLLLLVPGQLSPVRGRNRQGPR